MEASLPTGTVTFLFTDIEGSARMAREHRATWETLRARHNAILNAAIDAHRGYVFQIVGDAFCAAFHTSQDALSAAEQAQLELQAENWGDAPICVRMGIHTGGADVQDNGQYIGYLALSRVQRLTSAAHGRQVLVSRATQELVCDELPHGVQLRDLGEWRLKDVIRPEHIYQMVAANLPVDFPPLNALDLYLHNLPVQLTSFIGREKEMASVRRAVLEHRLVTLVGAGGTGKTRLSLQVAADLLDQFPDGVWIAELAPVTDPALMIQTVASIFNLKEGAGRSLEASLLDYLGKKTLLLVLDSCEHLRSACAHFADTFLHACPNLKILASSREALGVAGEAAFHVPPLTVPDPEHLPALEALPEFESMRLFLDRARLIQPAFAVTHANAPALAQICRRLDGIPLALELAAARMGVLAPEDLERRLDDRFRLLEGGSLTALPHHQTLRATIDWSYEFLTENERLLLQRLSVFAGGWTLAAAEAVCAGEEILTSDVLDLLAKLAAKSLVWVDNQGPEFRYRLLETVRQYADEKVTQRGDTVRLRNCHLEYFMEWAERMQPALRGPEQLLWMGRAESEHDNIRAALDWSLNGGDAESGLRLAGALFWFWYARSYWREGRRWLAALLERTQQRGWTPPRAKAVPEAAALALDWSPTDALPTGYHDCLEYWKGVGDDWWSAFARTPVGWQLIFASDPVSARPWMEEAVAFARKTNDHWILGYSLRCLAAALQRVDIPASRPILEESIQHLRAAGDRWALAEALNHLCVVPLGEGDYALAAALCEETLRICREIQDQGLIAGPLYQLMYAMLGLGNVDRAAELAREAMQLARSLGYPHLVAFGVLSYGYVASARGRDFRAITLLAAGEALLNAVGISELSWPVWRVLYERCFATAKAQLGEHEFNRAIAQGQAMTPEQAVAHALAQEL